jgi:hypothetical protein
MFLATLPAFDLRPSAMTPDNPGIGGTGEVLGRFYIDLRRQLDQTRGYTMFLPRSSIFLSAIVGIAALAAVTAAGENAQAQTSTPPAVAPTPRLKLTAEQEYIIREIIFKESDLQRQNTAPETIGDVVPDDIKLYPLPPEITSKVPQARSHMFFVKDDAVILVSSSDRRVADVIKKKATD